MQLRGVRSILEHVPPFYRVARRANALARRLVGPAWLRRQVARTARAGRPIRIVVGSSQESPPGWIATNVEYLNLLEAADWERALAGTRIDAVLAEHVWEHLTPDEGALAAEHCFEHLRPGGYLRIAVPDGNHPDPAYIEYVRPGGSGAGANDHKVLYTASSLRGLLEAAGFDVELLEYHDDAGRFHRRPWQLEDGVIDRRSGLPEQSVAGRPSEYTSLIVDATRGE